MILKLIFAFIISFAVSVAAGLVFIPMLRRMKIGQSIQEDGPVWHNSKQGTPTIGGIIFITGILAACLIVGFNEMREGSFIHIYIFVFALVFALIGFLDDYEKVKKKKNLGLTTIQKLALQLVAASVFVLIMELTGNLTTSVYVPFFNITFTMPAVLYNIFAAFVIVGTVNSVNLTDGTDGLSTGVTIPIAVFFSLIAFLWNDAVNGVFAAALAGGLIAFLFFNFYPAKVFMGDTGSLFLGGAICALAFSMDMPLILVTLGFVYFVVTLSVIIQVSYFKLTKGKRVFKMAPIQHHFEMCGWSEYKIFAVFTTVSVVFAIISYLGIMKR